MLLMMKTQTGKDVSIEGDSIEAKEALEIAAKLFDMFGLHAERTSRQLLYEVKPLHWADCPHFEVGEEDRVIDFIERGS